MTLAKRLTSITDEPADEQHSPRVEPALSGLSRESTAGPKGRHFAYCATSLQISFISVLPESYLSNNIIPIEDLQRAQTPEPERAKPAKIGASQDRNQPASELGASAPRLP